MASPFSAHLVRSDADELPRPPILPPPSEPRATALPETSPPTIADLAHEAGRLAHLFAALHYLRLGTAPGGLVDHVRGHVRLWLGWLASGLTAAGHGASAASVRVYAHAVQERLDTPTEDLRIAGRLADLAKSLGEEAEAEVVRDTTPEAAEEEQPDPRGEFREVGDG